MVFHEELDPQKAAFLAEDFRRGFPAFVGYYVTRVQYGLFETGLVVDQNHVQQDGFVHAGVMATMADHTMGYAAYSVLPDGYRILTIEYKVNFLRPAMGSSLRCLGKVLKRGRSVIPTEAEVYSLSGDDEPLLVAKVMGSMAAVAESSLKRT